MRQNYTNDEIKNWSWVGSITVAQNDFEWNNFYRINVFPKSKHFHRYLNKSTWAVFFKSVPSWNKHCSLSLYNQRTVIIIYKEFRGIMRSLLPTHTCLLAKINKTASLSSSSANILISSSRASPTRSRSLLSTTKIKP